MSRLHSESHRVARIGWLRAAVLGANDGIVSTASLLVGVAAATGSKEQVMLAGLAGLAAGALSMAAGEYVSVSSQSDTEKADLALEQSELATQPEAELNELTDIYHKRGLDPDLARTVAEQLTAHDAMAAHARDELAITDLTAARPLQAAMASALTFSIGAALPLLVVWLLPVGSIIQGVIGASLAALALLGYLGAQAGGAPVARSIARVVVWGLLAMAVTAGVGRLFGTAVG